MARWPIVNLPLPAAGHRRLERTSIAGAALIAAATAAVILVDQLRFAYHSPASHVALEAIATVVSILAAVLVADRFGRSRAPADFALLLALSLFAGTNLWFALLPDLVDRGASAVALWSRVVAVPAAFAALGLAPYLSSRAGMDRRRARRALHIVPAALIGGVAAGVALVHPSVPPGLLTARANRPDLDASTVVLVAQCFCAVAAAVATVGFLRRSRRERDELLAWMALAAVLGAFSRVHYALYPSQLSDWVSTGDLLRLGFYLTIMIGSLREIARYGAGLLEAAVLEDRRRIARDLHDGMAQEIAFVLAMLRTRGEERGWDAESEAMRDATERALSESRAAIDALSRPGEAPLDVLVGDAARRIAGREGAVLDLDLRADVGCSAEAADAIVRITREALTNALRHGRARNVTVRLWGEEGVRLAVEDDGCGFDPEDRVRPGHGLRTMRERADALGGRLSIASRPGAGTRLEVVLPAQTNP